MRYEYKTVRIPVDRPPWVFARAKPAQEYQPIIEEHAERGWRFVQIFAPPMTGYGHARFYDLIFERPKEQ